MNKLYFTGKKIADRIFEDCKDVLTDKKGLGTVEWVVLIVVVLILIALIGAYLYTLMNDTALPKVGNLVESIFNIGN